jgi:putative flippase GtrA
MKRFSRFLTVGVLNTAWGYALIFAFMYVFGLSPQTSNMLGYAIGLVTSYLLHRIFTFRSSDSKTPELVRFLLIFAISFGANLIVLELLLTWSLSAPISQVLAGVVYVCTSYQLNRRLVFRTSHGVGVR